MDYELALSASEVIKEGKDITLIGYGNIIRQLKLASELAEKEGISCEIIDL